ncbi:MAG TPA: CBS domain-containing protein [Candidatus Omnitrophota bacterium]|nr:CBS domain-containing protein [Candidatus Omnitrophota bacterium]HQO58902.1 CBS domain-containing protein [Candidatus Omnitrophota bacterium]
MVQNVVVVHQDTPLLEVMRILVEKQISGLPVVDKEEKLIGVITEKDLLRLLVSDVITSHEVVGDYMSLDVQFFSPDESVINICEFFIKTNLRRVPIVENGRVIGLISRRDIIKLILNSAQ